MASGIIHKPFSILDTSVPVFSGNVEARGTWRYFDFHIDPKALYYVTLDRSAGGIDAVNPYYYTGLSSIVAGSIFTNSDPANAIFISCDIETRSNLSKRFMIARPRSSETDMEFGYYVGGDIFKDDLLKIFIYKIG